MTDLHQIADEFTWGSEGFIRAISTHCGLDASHTEIERIASRTSSPEEFMAVWECENDWTDKTNA